MAFSKLEVDFTFLWFKESLSGLTKLNGGLDKKEQPPPEDSWESKLLLRLKNLLLVQKLFKVDNNTIQVETHEGLIIFFNPQADLDNQINSLQTILTKSRIEKRLLKRIDLRFNKVALEYR